MSDYIRFKEQVQICTKLQREAAEILETVADELDTHQRRLDKAKLGLASTGAVGGILTIVGLALAPVTFGASLGLSIAGGIIGGGSALGNIVSLIADKVISKMSLTLAQEKLMEYSKKTDTIRADLPGLMKILTEPERIFAQGKIEKSTILSPEAKKLLISSLQTVDDKILPLIRLTKLTKKVASSLSDVVETIITASLILSKAGKAGKVLNGMATAANAGKAAANAGKSIGTAADVGTDAAAATGKVVANSVKVAGIVMAGAGLALDLGVIIYYGIKVYKCKPDELATKIRTVAQCLKC